MLQLFLALHLRQTLKHQTQKVNKPNMQPFLIPYVYTNFTSNISIDKMLGELASFSL